MPISFYMNTLSGVKEIGFCMGVGGVSEFDKQMDSENPLLQSDS